jgi:hypothetical protein
MTRSQFLKVAMQRVRDCRDSELYGSHRDWSYLDDPYQLASVRGVVIGRRVA